VKDASEALAHGLPPGLGLLAGNSQIKDCVGRVKGSDAVRRTTTPRGGIVGDKLLHCG
jgi:hypothetical protein